MLIVADVLLLKDQRTNHFSLTNQKGRETTFFFGGGGGVIGGGRRAAEACLITVNGSEISA